MVAPLEMRPANLPTLPLEPLKICSSMGGWVKSRRWRAAERQRQAGGGRRRRAGGGEPAAQRQTQSLTFLTFPRLVLGSRVPIRHRASCRAAANRPPLLLQGMLLLLPGAANDCQQSRSADARLLPPCRCMSRGFGWLRSGWE